MKMNRKRKNCCTFAAAFTEAGFTSHFICPATYAEYPLKMVVEFNS